VPPTALAAPTSSMYRGYILLRAFTAKNSGKGLTTNSWRRLPHFNQQLLKQTLAEVEEVKLMLRTIFAGLKGSFNLEQLIERIACKDEVDVEIMHLLFEAGSPDLLPKDLATKLERFKVTRHHVTRRIERVNKRLGKKFCGHIAEKRGWHGDNKVYSGSLGRKRTELRKLNKPLRAKPVRMLE
jgi:hypothetical protein